MLHTIELVAATLGLLSTLAIVLEIAWFGRRIARLPAVSAPGRPLPRLSVIVPACNEEASVRQAVTAMLQQDYPNLELVLINDRSTDRTGEIMAELAEQNPGRVRVLTIAELPSGWLGKNHALWVGTTATTGEWLLFTDADVVTDPACYRRAVTLADAGGYDHLAMFPTFTGPTLLMRSFVAFFLAMFLPGVKPHFVSDPKKPRWGVGIGAFNLIRRSAYEAMGTHRAISMRPDDNVRLGRRVKALGLRQVVVNGGAVMQVQWYTSLAETVRGLEKNMFPALDYSLLKVAGTLAAALLVFVLPYGAVWFAGGALRLLMFGMIVGDAAWLLVARPVVGTPWRPTLTCILLFPLFAVIWSWALLRSTWLTLRRGGIAWRGTLYPLAELRQQTGLEGIRF